MSRTSPASPSDLGDAGTLIDFGQGDSVLLHGVSYDDIMADPSRFISLA